MNDQFMIIFNNLFRVSNLVQTAIGIQFSVHLDVFVDIKIKLDLQKNDNFLKLQVNRSTTTTPKIIKVT